MKARSLIIGLSLSASCLFLPSQASTGQTPNPCWTTGGPVRYSAGPEFGTTVQIQEGVRRVILARRGVQVIISFREAPYYQPPAWNQPQGFLPAAAPAPWLQSPPSVYESR